MTSILSSIRMPSFEAARIELPKPSTVALGGIAATSVVGGLAIGALKQHPLRGALAGSALAAIVLGAAFLGNASDSAPPPSTSSGGTRERDRSTGGVSEAEIERRVKAEERRRELREQERQERDNPRSGPYDVMLP